MLSAPCPPRVLFLWIFFNDTSSTDIVVENSTIPDEEALPVGNLVKDNANRIHILCHRVFFRLVALAEMDGYISLAPSGCLLLDCYGNQAFLFGYFQSRRKMDFRALLRLQALAFFKDLFEFMTNYWLPFYNFSKCRGRLSCP